MQRFTNRFLETLERRFQAKRTWLNEFGGCVCVPTALGIWASSLPYNVALTGLIVMTLLLGRKMEELKLGLADIDRQSLTTRETFILDGAYRRYSGINVGVRACPVFVAGWLLLGASILSRLYA